MIALFPIVLRLRRKGLGRLRRADKVMRLDCLKEACGLCCKVTSQNIVVLDSEIKILPKTALNFTPDGVFLSSKNGICEQLINNTCACYNARPKSCVEYPWYNKGGELFYDKGCPGIQFDIDERPVASSLTPIERYFPTHPTIRKILFAIMRVW